MATPLLKPLRVQGGTFFTFASAAKDIGKTFSDDNARFVFSKYALLDIPKVKTPANLENTILWQAMDAFGGNSAAGGTINLDMTSLDQNFNFSQGFQSYPLNFEQLILASQNNFNETYDETILSTTPERIFWHWMKNINAIRWQDANTTNESVIPDRYREENPGPGATAEYNQVVKYLGDIDVINNISKGGQSYTEIYIHVPTSHGTTPLVLFKSETDDNYQPNQKWEGDDNYLYGRTAGYGPGGLSKNAFYDDPSNDEYQLGSVFGDASNIDVTATVGTALPGTPYTVRLSKLEGVQLDFDSSNYYPVANNAQITSMDEFNASAASQDFEFNACLVYYDKYDVSNPDDFARNLYGILIIDDYENGPIESKLKNFKKFKPNAVTKLNGNSYGLKLNLKFDTENDNVGVETVIREDLTFGMDLFADASIRLQESADMFIDQKIEIVNIDNRLSTLEQYYFTQETLDVLNSKISALESGLANAQLNFEDETTILDLIRANTSNLNDVLSGKVNVQLTYNTDVVQPGPGIAINTAVPNQISIENTVNGYSFFPICANTAGNLSFLANAGIDPSDLTEGNRIVLGQFSNYYRNVNGSVTTLNGDVTINIDDTNFKWKTGQVMRLVIPEFLDLDIYTINIKTDSLNKYGQGDYGIQCGQVTAADTVTNKPIIEIICVDENTYSFYVDVVK